MANLISDLCGGMVEEAIHVFVVRGGSGQGSQDHKKHLTPKSMKHTRDSEQICGYRVWTGLKWWKELKHEGETR